MGQVAGAVAVLGGVAAGRCWGAVTGAGALSCCPLRMGHLEKAKYRKNMTLTSGTSISRPSHLE